MSVAQDPVFLPLRDGRVAVISAQDADLAAFKWTANRGGYAVRHSRKLGTIYLHRIIASRLYGTEHGALVDHIDRNRLNNQRLNIRLASPSQSTVNRGTAKGAQSGYRGVYFMKRRKSRPWLAQIGVNRKSVYLGYYATPEDAARAYDAAALVYYGEFAELNRA